MNFFNLLPRQCSTVQRVRKLRTSRTRISSATSKGSHFPTAVSLRVIGAETPEARTVWKKLQWNCLSGKSNRATVYTFLRTYLKCIYQSIPIDLPDPPVARYLQPFMRIKAELKNWKYSHKQSEGSISRGWRSGKLQTSGWAAGRQGCRLIWARQVIRS